MKTILFGTLALFILAFIVIAMYSALIIAGRSDEQVENENSEGDDIEMFFKK